MDLVSLSLSHSATVACTQSVPRENDGIFFLLGLVCLLHSVVLLGRVKIREAMCVPTVVSANCRVLRNLRPGSKQQRTQFAQKKIQSAATQGVSSPSSLLVTAHEPKNTAYS